MAGSGHIQRRGRRQSTWPKMGWYVPAGQAVALSWAAQWSRGQGVRWPWRRRTSDSTLMGTYSIMTFEATHEIAGNGRVLREVNDKHRDVTVRGDAKERSWEARARDGAVAMQAEPLSSH